MMNQSGLKRIPKPEVALLQVSLSDIKGPPFYHRLFILKDFKMGV